MSLPAWPADLSFEPLTDGFGVPEPHVPPIATEFDGGGYRRRPRTTMRRALLTLSWQFEPAERDTFRQFYHLTLGEGSQRFTMLVPDGAVNSYVSRTCQFKGMYKEGQPRPPYWIISAELYVFGGP